MNEEELIETAKRKARQFFAEKRANCAESVFRAIYELVETDLPPQVSGLTTPLGGGVGIRGANCGAMLAGVVAMAIIYGRRNPYEGELRDHREHLWKTYGLYNQLPSCFEERFGTIECWNLTRPHVYGTEACRRFCEDIIAETAGMVMALLVEAKETGLNFEFKKTLLSQAAEATGLPVKQLIAYKAKAQPFPSKD